MLGAAAVALAVLAALAVAAPRAEARKSFSSCPADLACRVAGCSDVGVCIFSSDSSEGCAAACKCQCTSDDRVLFSSSSSCPSDLACRVEGCTAANNTCVFASAACRERCVCGCTFAPAPKRSQSSCSGGWRCSCDACNPDGTCYYNNPRCRDVCRGTCSS